MLLNQANWSIGVALMEFKCRGISRGLGSASIDLVELPLKITGICSCEEVGVKFCTPGADHSEPQAEPIFVSTTFYCEYW